MDLSQISTHQLEHEIINRRACDQSAGTLDPHAKAERDARVARGVTGIGGASQLRVWSDEETRKATFRTGELTPQQSSEFEVITRQAETLIEFVQKYCPSGPDRAQALQMVRTGVHFAQLSLTHEGVPFLK